MTKRWFTSPVGNATWASAHSDHHRASCSGCQLAFLNPPGMRGIFFAQGKTESPSLAYRAAASSIREIMQHALFFREGTSKSHDTPAVDFAACGGATEK